MSAAASAGGWPVHTTRQTIAVALSTVPGVTGSALPPSTPGPGAAWPQAVADGRVRINDYAADVTYWVWCVLPASGQAAELAYDEIVWQIEDALDELGQVVSAGPWALPLGPGAPDTVPAVRVTLRVTQTKG